MIRSKGLDLNRAACIEFENTDGLKKKKARKNNSMYVIPFTEIEKTFTENDNTHFIRIHTNKNIVN